jgi:hypothetical protein
MDRFLDGRAVGLGAIIGFVRGLILCLTLFSIAGIAQAPKKDSLTGCVDQRGNDFVLAGDKELHQIAVLHYVGMSDDNFAREVGHKVTVEGTLSKDGDVPVMRVTKLKTISETCSPD